MDDKIREVEKLMDELAQDPGALARYSAMERAKYDRASAIEWARRTGWEEGYAKGYAEEWEKGREEGREESKVVIILNLVRAKADMELICKATELTESEVKAIIEKNS
ncbi:MAG: hypothetical protein ACRCWQ_03590 [Bacilli bacterium]